MFRNPKSISRRSALKTVGAAALFKALHAAFPAGAFAAGAGPEVAKATLGYIALTDAAPLIVAKEKGFYAKHGMPDVEVQKQASWGTTRDNIELGAAHGGIDGAHILTPLPYLISSGKVTKNNQKRPMYILARLNTNGQAISVAKSHAPSGAKLDASPLRPTFAKLAAAGKDVKVAMTFRGGTHDFWLRYWLAAGGIDPDKDVQTIVVPPPQMVANMKVGSMEAFCVGEPWNAQLVNQGIGYTAVSTGELWPDHPEKSLGLRADWVDTNPKSATALVMAVQEAAQWCDKAENKTEMCQILARRAWFNVPVEDIVGRAKGEIDYGDGRKVADSKVVMKYWNEFANFPFRSHELWFLTEAIRWGILPADTDTQALLGQVNRDDLWRDAAKALGVAAAAIPPTSSRGVETFFDGKTFDPANPGAYLKSLAIKRLTS